MPCRMRTTTRAALDGRWFALSTQHRHKYYPIRFPGKNNPQNKVCRKTKKHLP